MTGRVKFEKWGGPREVTLGDDLAWSADGNEMIELYMRETFRPDRSPSVGDAGLTLLYKTAETLGGTVEDAREPIPSEPGRVY